MKRRHFLGATAAGLAATAAPPFIHEAFGDSAACDANGQPKGAAEQAALVAAALRRAQHAKRPLLVFVIPADDAQKRERGQAFGELLNHGGDKDLAPLSDAEVVCATMADLKKVVPGAGTGEPLMVLVKTDRTPPAATSLDAALPSYDIANAAGSWEERQKAEERITDQRIAALGEMLRKALGADQRKLAARAAGVRARLVKQRPPGAHWARSSGCGTRIEGVNDNVMIGCGMGHVPAKSERFLYFFSIERQTI
jgi:hypothetical protein